MPWICQAFDSRQNGGGNSAVNVSVRVCFVRFCPNKLTADALTVCLCVFHDAHKTAARMKLRCLYVPRSEDSIQVYLDDNASINSFPVENRPAHKYLCWVFSMTYLIYFKNEDCACQKSLAIRTDGVSFQIILAKPALTAILGHYTA